MHRVGPYEYTPTDAERTFASAGHLWRHHVHDLAGVGVVDVPSEAFDAAAALAARLADQLGVDAREPAADAARAPALAERLDSLGAAAARASASWSGDAVERELGALWAALDAVAGSLRGAGAFGASTVGGVVQLSTSGGGVPKRPVDAVDVTFGGVVGDVQAARQHHGRPWQALCVWSREVIDGLAAAGHPIAPGLAGENITVAGLDWRHVRPGAHLQLGDVRCRVSAYTIPCTKNARWFLGRAHGTMHHDRGPVSRVYATVLEPGRIRTGDTAVLEP